MYRIEGSSSCREDCKGHGRCTCAFYMLVEAAPFSNSYWCAAAALNVRLLCGVRGGLNALRTCAVKAVAWWLLMTAQLRVGLVC